MKQHKLNEEKETKQKQKYFRLKFNIRWKCSQIVGSNIHGIHKIFEHYVRPEQKPV